MVWFPELAGLVALALLSALDSGPGEDDLDFTALVRPLPGGFERVQGRVVFKSSAVLADPDHFVWGGSPIRGRDGRYHLFYSRWSAGPDKPRFGDGWLLDSEICHAVSVHPDRGFHFQGVVLRGRRHEGAPRAWDSQGVHNPHIQCFAGRYYLYYIGSHDPGPQPPASPGAGLSKRDRIQQMQKIGLIAVDRLEDLIAGRFQRPSRPLLAERTRVKPAKILFPSPPGTAPSPANIIVVNPSVVRRPGDGRYLLYFKGNLYDPRWRGVHGYAIGERPEGPFEIGAEFVFQVRLDDGRIASAEDPYAWYDRERRRFYAIIKDFSGRITGAGPGLGLFTSGDGIHWKAARHPLACPRELRFASGQRLAVANLERPQLLFDAAGHPRALFAACSVASLRDRRDGDTVNVQIPLRAAERL